MRGKLAFVTGASSGIGLACARLLAREGVRLLLCARREERLMEVAEELRSAFQAEVYWFALDVSDRSGVREKLEALPSEWQQVDILINNAGLALGRDPLQEGDTDDWQVMVDTNILGLLSVTRFFLPQMIARGVGHIINIGSIAGHEVYPGGAVYCATKHAVRALTEGLRHDLLGTPVRASAVDPGAVETEFSVVRFKGDQRRADDVYRGMTPLAAEDVAEAVHFCLTRPPHVNVGTVVLYPKDQAGSFAVHRHG